MPRKPKFRPEITWINLNPEQAVLSCDCNKYGRTYVASDRYSLGSNTQVCIAGKHVDVIRSCEAPDDPWGVRDWEANTYIGSSVSS